MPPFREQASDGWMGKFSWREENAKMQFHIIVTLLKYFIKMHSLQQVVFYCISLEDQHMH